MPAKNNSCTQVHTGVVGRLDLNPQHRRQSLINETNVFNMYNSIRLYVKTCPTSSHVNDARSTGNDFRFRLSLVEHRMKRVETEPARFVFTE